MVNERRFNMKHILETDKLHMELDMNIFYTDIKYSSNTVMYIAFKCDEFSAQISMDIDIKEFAVFSEKISDGLIFLLENTM